MELKIAYPRGELGENQSRALVTQLGKMLSQVTVSAVPFDFDEGLPYCEGVFASPLDVALLNTEVEAYVASLQDIGVLLPEGLKLVAVTQRVDVRDAAVTANGFPLRAMPEATQVIVDGPRRAQQVKLLRSDLEPVIVPMRPEKLLSSIDAGDDQAGLFAMSDLCWMKMDSKAAEILSLDDMLPGPGQGALGLVVREIDTSIEKALSAVNHKLTWARVTAERLLVSELGWNSCAPIGVLAEIAGDNTMKLRASAFGASESEVVCAEGADSPDNAEDLARRVADDLRRAGGDRIIRESRQSSF